MLIADDGRLVAILDWDHAQLSPASTTCGSRPRALTCAAFLRAYGGGNFDATHLEYALVRRAVGDLAARIVAEVDRPGIDTWGFDRWHRLEANLAVLLASP